MALLVEKFGGTSVGNVERIHRIAELVEQTYRAGNQVVVVVSAMSGETDRLLRLAHEITPQPDDRELDVLLSSGERVTIALLAMKLRSRGINARSFTGRQVGIVTNSSHTRARIAKVMADPVKQALAQGVLPIVAGFQGVNERSEVTTLGRGGSDLTAVALAATLKADRCVIFTDVDGVYTTDPNVVPAAQRIPKLSYEEMLELASLGAKVLQARSVEFAAKYRVPVQVKSSFQEGEGTLVTHEDEDMEQAVVSGVTGDRNQAKITVVGVPDRPGIAANLFGVVAEHSIVVDMIIQNGEPPGCIDGYFLYGAAERPDACHGAGQTNGRGNRRRGRRSHGGNCQGLAGGSRHAVPFGRGVTHVPNARAGKNQHHDDQHVRNQRFPASWMNVTWTKPSGPFIRNSDWTRRPNAPNLRDETLKRKRDSSMYVEMALGNRLVQVTESR